MPESSPDLSHSHYSPAVQEAVSVFTMTYAAWIKIDRKNLKDNMIRLDSLQSCWDALARARIKETGTGFYLNKTEYKKATQALKSKKS